MITNILASTVVSSFLVAILGIVGKFWVDRQIEKDKHEYEKSINDLKIKLEIALHADKSIFEKEFKGSVETWNSLLKFKTETEYLHRDVSDRVAFETQKEKCFKQHELTHDLLYNNAPFLPEEIRDAFFNAGSNLQKLYQLPENFSDDEDYAEKYIVMYEHEVEAAKKSILELEKMLRNRYLQPGL